MEEQQQLETQMAPVVLTPLLIHLHQLAAAAVVQVLELPFLEKAAVLVAVVLTTQVTVALHLLQAKEMQAVVAILLVAITLVVAAVVAQEAQEAITPMVRVA